MIFANIIFEIDRKEDEIGNGRNKIEIELVKEGIACKGKNGMTHKLAGNFLKCHATSTII